MKIRQRAIATIGILSLSAIATVASADLVRSVTFTPPPENETPQQSAAASSRSGELCGATRAYPKARTASVTVLLPQQNYGTTVSAHPDILVYVPETSASEALFSLKTADKRLVHTMTVPLSGKGEIITVHLPETAPALEVGETYKWYLAVKCEGSLRPIDPAEGQIKRIQPNSAQLPTTESSDPLQVAAAYGAAGIWYDTVAVLAQLRKAEPNNAEIANHWNELLESAGLTELVDVAIGN